MTIATEFFGRLQRTVDKAVDETFYELNDPGTRTTDLERQMPAQTYNDTDLFLAKIRRGLPTIGSLVAPEQEIPSSRSLLMYLDTESIAHGKIGKAYRWGETELRKIHDMDRMARTSGNSALYKQFEDAMIWNIQSLSIGVTQKSIVLASQIQTTGGGTYTDPLTGAQYAISYADKLEATLTPAALTATNMWTAPLTAKPLANLRTHARAWYDKFGMYPREVTMRRETFDLMLECNEVKTVLMANAGGDNPSASMIDAILPTDEQMIALIRQRCKIETVTINDSYYAEEYHDANGIPQIRNEKYVPRYMYYFTEPMNIERAWLPTAEKKFQSGLFTLTEEVNKAPVHERSVVIGCCIPVAYDPRKIGFRTVAA
jgi:hypothetical protein